MAGKRKNSGFDAPTYGTMSPKGTKIKKNPDGTITLIEPKKKPAKKKSK